MFLSFKKVSDLCKLSIIVHNTPFRGPGIAVLNPLGWPFQWLQVVFSHVDPVNTCYSFQEFLYRSWMSSLPWFSPLWSSVMTPPAAMLFPGAWTCLSSSGSHQELPVHTLLQTLHGCKLGEISHSFSLLLESEFFIF